MRLTQRAGLAGVALTALGLALGRPAAADSQYTITLSGVFNSVDSSVFAGVSVGDTFTDSFTLPLAAPGLLFSGPGRSIFRDSSASSGDTIRFDGETITPYQFSGHYAQLDTAISAPPGQYTYPDIPPTQDSLDGTSDGSGAGQQYVQVSWFLSTAQDPATHALTQNLALPLSGPGLSDITAWQNTGFLIQSFSLGSFRASARPTGILAPRGGPGQLAGTITGITETPAGGVAVVPECSPLALLAAGLLPLGLIAARRRAGLVPGRRG